jgi:UPF0042 nucleotide-binding protein
MGLKRSVDGISNVGGIDMSSAAKCVIISGLSAAGKSTALRMLEDRGFYVVDNLPPVMLPSLMEALALNKSALMWGVAAVVDMRGEKFISEIESAMDAIEKSGTKTNLIFLDASDEALIRRYETTRRRHPLGEGITTMEGISRERVSLAALKKKSEIVVDTSEMIASELRAILLEKLEMNEFPFTVIVSSFGFKNGIPRDCDFLFDMRFLPNPNYVPELKPLSGRNIEVQNYLDKIPEKQVFMKHLVSLMEFILKHYENTGKKQLHVAIGCTGGRHRSVAIVEQLSKIISDSGLRTATNHRDIDLEGN